MKKTVFLICVLFLFLFVSCTSVKNPGNSTSPVYVTNTKKIFILPTRFISEPVDCMQIVNGKFGDQSFGLMGYLSADETNITLSLFNDFGTDMGNLSYDGFAADFDSAVFPPELKAEYLINDLQCAYYQADALKENFSNSKLEFIESLDNGIITRKIFNGNTLISEIVKSEDSVTIKNHLRGYEFELLNAE